MNSMPLYLKAEVKMEPLINSWYAWSYLVSPLTFSLLTKKLHLRVLDSYLKSPNQHKKALKNKAMRGGLFLDHDGDIEDVALLRDSTMNDLTDLLTLSEQVQQFSICLNERADGSSLTELYKELPESLKGRVELGYDLFNQASVRFIEPFFYGSDFYKPTLQSLSFSHLDGDNRPFVLSSPRLPSTDTLIVSRAFNDRSNDSLFAMRSEPQDLRFIQDYFGWDELEQAQRDLMLTFFSEQKPASCHEPVADQLRLRVRYFGHATVLLETQSVTVMTDPIISYDQEVGESRFSYKDLPEKIDYVVLTHNHQDHVMLETLLQIRHRIGTIIVPRCSGGSLHDLSLKLMLEVLGFESVIDISEMETVNISGGLIRGIPFLGEHGDLSILSKLAFNIELGGETFLFAADSNNLDPRLYQNLHKVIGSIDHVFIGMECEGAPMSWLYGPLYPRSLERKHDVTRRLDGSDSDKAYELIRALNPKSVYVYAMGAEPWLTFISSIDYTDSSRPIIESDKLITRCLTEGIQAERLYGMKQIEHNKNEQK